MSLGKETAVKIADWSQSTQDSHSFTGNLKFCKRPQAGEPKWLLFATDTGEVRVYDYLGVHQAAHDVALGYNPTLVEINNEDTPKIAAIQGSTIRVYESGSEIFNTGAITNLRDIGISNNYLHSIENNTQLRWRSLTDGSLLHTVTPSFSQFIYRLTVTEGGGTVYAVYGESATVYGVVIKAITSGVVWYRSILRDRNNGWVECAGDGSIYIADIRTEIVSVDETIRVADENDTLIDTYAFGAQRNVAIAADPNGQCAAWARLATTTARIIEYDGTTHDLVLPAVLANRRDAIEIVSGPYILFECADGNIYIYNLAGTLKATVNYGLATSPLAAVIK